MKIIKLNIIALVFLLNYSNIFAQATNCSNADPFCTGTNYNFPASTNAGSAQNGPDYGCLWSQPNPAWYYLEIDNPGNITINIQGGSQPNTNDIDFICWGPFSNPATMCNQLTGANIEDCSYSPTWNEFCQINGANSGDYYVLLITNYSNSPCNINFSQTAGNATTNCCILGGDAGDDNTVNVCETDPIFDMQSQLLGNPDNGGNWFNSNWNNVTSNFNPSNLNSGIYAYIVNGSSSACPDDTSYLTINVNLSPIVSFPIIPNLCANDSAVILNTAQPLGGTYSGNGVYSNIFTPSINIIGTNSITYSYTDQNGCTNSANQNITVNENPYATAITTNVSCNGLSDGSAYLNITGGLTSYIENWGGYNPLSLASGSYSYTVTDANGCTFSDSLIIYEPPVFTVTNSIQNVSCNGGNDGTAAIYLQGGSTPTGNTVSTLNYCTSTSGSDMASTIDNVTLQGDMFNITNNTTGICDQYEDYTGIYADITEGQSYTIDVTLGDCSNTTNYASGGKIYIDWNIDGDFFDPGEEIGTIPYTTNSTVSISFTVPFSGAYGATRMRVVSQFLNNTPNPVNNMGPCDVGVMANPIYIQPWFGATEDYSIVVNSATVNGTYLWSNGATVDSISNLSAGNYFVTITNDNGCSLTDFITITEPTLLTSNAIATDVTCDGFNDGNISLTIFGGTTDYNINAAGFSQLLTGGVNTFTTPSLLPAGTYSYIISDSSGCTFSDSVTINSPNPITIIESVTNVNCFGGNDGIANLTISGGNPNYIEDWGANNPSALNAGIFYYTITDSNGCIENDSIMISEPSQLYSTSLVIDASSCGTSDGSIDVTIGGGTSPYVSNWSNGANTEDIFNLSSGIYTVNIIDNNGCTENLTATVTEPPTASINYTQVDVSCYGGADGSIDLNVIGGTAPFLYLWSNGETTQNIYNLSAGIYNVTITDANNCIKDTLVIIQEPNNPNISTTQVDVSCNGYTDGSIDLSTLGLSPPIQYIWSNGANSEDIINLTAGNYTYTITDANACIYTNTVTINQPTTIQTNPNVLDVSCKGLNDGLVILNTSGGTQPYIEDWGGVNASSLSPGVYNYIITDFNNCSYTNSININEPDSLLAIHILTDVDCFSGNTGTANISISGGTPPYSQNWGASNPNALNAGNHSYIITDINNCTYINQFNINQPSPINVLIDTFRTSCFGSSDGKSTLSVSGGIGPYIEDWGGANPLSLAAGIYPFTVTDSNNCVFQGQAIITQPDDLIINEIKSDVSCFGLTNGSAYLQINGGTMPYVQDWNGINTLALSKGTYTYTVTDANNCIKTNYININEPDILKASATIINANCFNSSDGQAILNITGGTEPYNENWYGDNPYALSAGIYNFKITDINGCDFDSSVVINQANEIILDYTAESPICENETTSLNINITNPNSYQYTLNIKNGLDTNIFMIDSTGVLYPEGIPITLTPKQTINLVIISIIDEFGCASSTNKIVEVIVNPLPSINLSIEDVCINDSPFELSQLASPSGGSYTIDGFENDIFDIPNLSEGPHEINYNLTDSNNCNNSIDSIIYIHPNPIAKFNFSPQPTTIEDSEILFRNQSQSITSSYWEMGDGNFIYDSLEFTHLYIDTGTYIVSLAVSNIHGCTDTLAKYLTINPLYEIFIPNAFTPNNDGDNDLFTPSLTGVNSFTITIYDKWGGIIFKEKNKPWDGSINGSKVTGGIYPYFIEVADYKNKVFHYTGYVTLIN